MARPLRPSRKQLNLLRLGLVSGSHSIGRHLDRNVFERTAGRGKARVAIKLGAPFFRPVKIKQALEFVNILRQARARSYNVRAVKVFFATEARVTSPKRIERIPGGGIAFYPEERANEREFLVMEKIAGLNAEQLSTALSGCARGKSFKKRFGNAAQTELMGALPELLDNFHALKKKRNISGIELTTNNVMVESFNPKTRKFNFVLIDLYNPFVG